MVLVPLVKLMVPYKHKRKRFICCKCMDVLKWRHISKRWALWYLSSLVCDSLCDSLVLLTKWFMPLHLVAEYYTGDLTVLQIFVL